MVSYLVKSYTRMDRSYRVEEREGIANAHATIGVGVDITSIHIRSIFSPCRLAGWDSLSVSLAPSS